MDFSFLRFGVSTRLNARSGSDLASAGFSRRRTPSWRSSQHESTLLLAYGTNANDSVEFAVFYDAKSSREFFLTGNSTKL